MRCRVRRTRHVYAYTTESHRRLSRSDSAAASSAECNEETMERPSSTLTPSHAAAPCRSAGLQLRTLAQGRPSPQSHDATFPLISFPSPFLYFLSLPFPSLLFPSFPWTPSNPVRESGAPSAGSGAECQPKSNSVHSSLKIRHLVATILKLFS